MVLSAEDCSSTPWNRPWEPVRSYHASRLRRRGPWARSADLVGRPACSRLQPPQTWYLGCPGIPCPMPMGHDLSYARLLGYLGSF